MKKVFLMAALVLTSMASANSLKDVDARLSAELRPLRGFTLGGIQRGVYVTRDGAVVYYEAAANQEFDKEIKIAQLSVDRMAQVETQIEAAADGEQKQVVEFCEAIPTRSFNYAADNGKVALLSGAAPCGGRMVNEAPEAKELVDLLNRYLHARN